LGIFQPGNPHNGQSREKSGSSRFDGGITLKIEAEQRQQRQAIFEEEKDIESKRGALISALEK
jgi:hypothetical protein